MQELPIWHTCQLSFKTNPIAHIPHIVWQRQSVHSSWQHDSPAGQLEHAQGDEHCRQLGTMHSGVMLLVHASTATAIHRIKVNFIQKVINFQLQSSQPVPSDIMFKKWSAYTLRARNVRQKYFTLLHQKVNAKTSRILANTRRRIVKGVVFGSAAIATYYFCNEMYSEHLEKKKMKKKLMKAYPDQTYIISFEEDPMDLLREVEIKNTDDQQEVNPLENKRCILITDKSDETKSIQGKLGSNVIVFSPKNLDQLCHVIERCHKYRHTAIVGHYPMPSVQSLSPDFQEIKKALGAIEEPMNKQKYVVVDLSLFRDFKIDQINGVLEVDSGALCGPVNQYLKSNGFQPLFQEFYDGASLYEVVVNNWPLRSCQYLTNSIQNLSLVSAEGKRFKSSIEVEKFGQVPNLTSLFVGTGGVFAVPAKISLRVHRQQAEQTKHTYTIQADNVNDLVLKWRQFRKFLSANKLKYQLLLEDNKMIVQTNGPRIPSKTDYVFSINSRILQKLILNGRTLNRIVVDNNLLKVQQDITNDEIRRLISDITLEGGVLVWCRDKQACTHIKERIDILEAGAELMKKIVQVREGIDKRQVLYSHPRYEKYFAKGFFRKITQFFW